MNKLLIILTFFIMGLVYPSNLYCKLLISEFSISSTTGDWVEIFFKSDKRESLDISHLYVTMYYGQSQKLSTSPVTLYSYDRRETPYDDRYAVVHLTDPSGVDESDLKGDINQNQTIDIYCDNYSGSLWNSEGVVAIDTNHDPADGMIDFVAYSNQDGGVNEALVKTIKHAAAQNQWEEYISQQSMFFIGSSSLPSYRTINRKNFDDTNRKDDFIISSWATPGRPNKFKNESARSKIFKIDKRVYTIIPQRKKSGKIGLSIFLPCSLKVRIFNSIGRLVYQGKTYENLPPGKFYFDLPEQCIRKMSTGLYIVHLSGRSKEFNKNQIEKSFIIISRYR